MDGILLLIKEENMTSRDLVNDTCHKFNMKKIGHTGTLDPFAKGLMVLTLGKATKISSYLEQEDKTYIGEMTLGIKTDTLDITGNIIERKEVPTFSKEEIENIFKKFIGDIKQIPPMYSAIKIHGEELYKMARRGEIIERKPRDVTIKENNLLSLEKDKILFEVTCSKGTYIRSLASDIGEVLGCYATLSMLVRTRVGKFHLKDAKYLKDVKEEDLVSMKDALSFLPSFIVSKVDEAKVRNGVKLFLNRTEEKLVIYAIDQTPLAIYQNNHDGYFTCLRGLL